MAPVISCAYRTLTNWSSACCTFGLP